MTKPTIIRRTASEVKIAKATQLLQEVDPRRVPLRFHNRNPFLEEAREQFYRIEDGLEQEEVNECPTNPPSLRNGRSRNSIGSNWASLPALPATSPGGTAPHMAESSSPTTGGKTAH
jgi:hypothetical protein